MQVDRRKVFQDLVLAKEHIFILDSLGTNSSVEKVEYDAISHTWSAANESQEPEVCEIVIDD